MKKSQMLQQNINQTKIINKLFGKELAYLEKNVLSNFFVSLYEKNVPISTVCFRCLFFRLWLMFSLFLFHFVK